MDQLRVVSGAGGGADAVASGHLVGFIIVILKIIEQLYNNLLLNMLTLKAFNSVCPYVTISVFMSESLGILINRLNDSLVVRQTLDRQTQDTTNPRQTNGGHSKH